MVVAWINCLGLGVPCGLWQVVHVTLPSRKGMCEERCNCAADVLKRLAAADGADVVVARSARGLEPLCAIYSRACAGDIRARLERGAYEASTLPAGFRVAEVGVERALVFVNVNTPHDYERARNLVESE